MVSQRESQRNSLAQPVRPNTGNTPCDAGTERLWRCYEILRRLGQQARGEHDETPGDAHQSPAPESAEAVTP